MTRQHARRSKRQGKPKDTDQTVAIIRTGTLSPSDSEAVRFLEWEFVRFAWEARFPTWTAALRSLARTLQGLEKLGWIARHRVAEPSSRRSRRVIALTDDGEQVLRVIRGGPVPGGTPVEPDLPDSPLR